jgi:hypothetical protein
MTQTFRIPAANLGSLEEALVKLARRAVRLHVTAPTWVVGPEQTEPVVDPVTGRVERHRVWREVTLTSQPVGLSGWTFVATLDHTTEAGVVVRAMPGIVLDARYRTADPDCVHCGRRIRRLATFVLRATDGTEKQVGRNCLSNFFASDPAALASAAEAELVMLAREACEDGEFWGEGGGSTGIDLHYYLSTVHAVIAKYGWMSRGAAREQFREGAATADIAGAIIDERRRGDETEIKNSPEGDAAATAAIDWVRSLTNVDSDYMHNLSVVCAGEAVSFKNLGIAASLMSTWQREMGREAERKHAAATSHHIGTVGKREVFTLTVTGLRSFDSDFGARWMVRFADATGNVVVWWTGSDNDLVIGRTYRVKATVKKHEDYKGIAQTTVTRCAIEGEVAAAA